MLELTFLGTAAAVPSRTRTMSCIAVKQGPSVTLFDCAEGTQRQLMVSPLSFMKVDSIFITHMHGDHMLGLPGLIQTMGLSGRTRPLAVYGPEGLSESVDKLLSACEGEIGYELTVNEIGPGDVVKLADAEVHVFRTEHGIASQGYIYREKDLPGKFDKAKALSLGLSPGPDFARIQNGETVNGVSPEDIIGPARKGASIAYTGDTVKLDSVADAVRGVTVLIHESTYSGDDAELAVKNFHSTCVQAAQIASAAGAGCLILTHISNRYSDNSVLTQQAREVFPETYVAKDMGRFEVSVSGVRQV